MSSPVSALLESVREQLAEPWFAVSRVAMGIWAGFYALFLLYLYSAHGGFTAIDNVNLIVHESGHLFFSWAGDTMTLLGGTIMELLVPFLLFSYFFWKRHLSGTAFCLFVFFENFIYIATYMADARAQELPLVSVGDSGENSPHDWFNIFTRFGGLQYDTRIAAFVRFAGWLGMLVTVGWFLYRAYRNPADRAMSAGASE